MTKQIYLGALFLIIGIGLHYLLEGSDYTFFSGLLIGLGIGLLITSFKKKTDTSKEFTDG
jgi:hypothetical protein